MDDGKVQFVPVEPVEFPWPVEARTIEEARSIWARNGFYRRRVMTAEEVKREFGVDPPALP